MQNLKTSDEVGKKVNELVSLRAESLNKIINAEKELSKLGVKFGQVGEDGSPTFEVGSNYLPQFLHHLDEYEWEVTYKDGSILRQHDINGDNHYGNIKHEAIKRVRLLSNFEVSTDNQERRVIITLDWETGKFDILNGQIDIDDRNTLTVTEESGPKKLILFKRVRFGQTMDISSEKPTSTGEVYFYKRNYIGYETENKKILICLYPDGRVGIE